MKILLSSLCLTIALSAVNNSAQACAQVPISRSQSELKYVLDAINAFASRAMDQGNFDLMMSSISSISNPTPMMYVIGLTRTDQHNNKIEKLYSVYLKYVPVDPNTPVPAAAPHVPHCGPAFMLDRIEEN